MSGTDQADGSGGSGQPVPRDFATATGANTTSDSSTVTQRDEAPQAAQGAGRAPEHPHVHYSLSIETKAQDGPEHDFTSKRLGRSDTQASRRSALISPTKRRLSRAATFRTVDDFEDFEVHPGWHPGSEPGVDPRKADGGHASMPDLSARCKITVVDFSVERLAMQSFDNDTLVPFLKQPQPAWAKCRWINVNGLSWDVIQALGQYKNLHNLAIEDVLNTRNRTKADWYPTHAFIVLNLVKLVQLYSKDRDLDPESESDSDDAASRKSGWSKKSGRYHRRAMRRLRRLWGRDSEAAAPEQRLETGGGDGLDKLNSVNSSQSADFSDISELRTLQQYHASPNDTRTRFMEERSALASKHLAVACEQVCIFITRDNTVISFFESSAADVEDPIIRRLQNRDTIIRQSCDASMIGQAIIDAIIDLAIPVSRCYSEAIGDIELNVLTSPTIEHARSLYVLISEVNMMFRFINPIVAMINALRDHKSDGSPDKLRPGHEAIITPMTYMYFADVLDHCLLIVDRLHQIKGSADGMISLIFNTISANQNESMKQLTMATIIFLPLTFITGYFGQNFVPFNVLYEDVGYFWKIATPVVVATILILQKDAIYAYYKSLAQKRYIGRLREDRRRRSNRKRH